MMSLPSDYSWQPGPYRLLIEQFDALGLPRRLLGRTLFDMPIYAYRVGSTGPEVMVTAGAHAEEVAGVVTAYHLARNFPSGLQGWIVPCRDPLGWDGFRRCLHRAIGDAVGIENHRDVVDALRRYGSVYEAEGAVVGLIGDLAFFALPEDHPEIFDPGDFAHAFFARQAEIREKVAGRRIIVHGSPNLAEGRDIYDWGGGPTLYISEDGQVGNFNRFFAHQHPPVEVVVIRDLTAEVRPQWVFDLHENYGSKYSLYANVSTDLGKRGAREMTKAVEALGMELMRLEELFSYVKPPHPEFLTEPSPGIFMPSRVIAQGVPDAYGVYAASLGADCYTTEMGLENPLAVRIEMTEVSVRACLELLRAP